MADHFLQGLENLKHSFSLSDISTDPDPNLDFMMINQFYNNSIQHSGFSLDNPFFPPSITENIVEYSAVKSENFSDLFLHHEDINPMPQQTISNFDNNNHIADKKKRKASMEIPTPLTSPASSSPQVSSDNGGINITRKNGKAGRGKRVKGDEKKEEIHKKMEVVHVRAKRGQATDSHSLAERVRREKINERLKCLQDIVPGCYKTMGMAVMLDEIINYVQSLQNQVEFLSMKLTTASSFYDFNSEADALQTMQRQKAFEALKIENGVFSADQFAPLDLMTYGCFPQLPHNR